MAIKEKEDGSSWLAIQRSLWSSFEMFTPHLTCALKLQATYILLCHWNNKHESFDYRVTEGPNLLITMEKVGQQAGYSKVKEEDTSIYPLTGL